jgi:hypothetical protein
LVPHDEMTSAHTTISAHIFRFIGSPFDGLGRKTHRNFFTMGQFFI